MNDPLALVHVLRPQLEELLEAQAVKKERGQNCPIPLALEGVHWRGGQQHPRLAVADGRRLALIHIRFGSLHTIDGVGGDGVLLAQIIEEAGQGGELAPDGGRLQRPGLQTFAPREHVGSRHVPKFLRCGDPDEPYEFANIDFVRGPGARIV